MSKLLKKLREKLISEQATGIREQGSLIFYSNKMQISPKEAKEYLISGYEVAVPSAGSGSYHEIFNKMGFSDVKVIDWTSSAGDWTFGIKDKTGWRLASQDNRYPYYGFRYYADNHNLWGFATFEDLVKEIEFMYG